MTRLEAINQMLAGIGEAPVSFEDSQHPDVLVAINILNLLIEFVQSKGYWFNKVLSVVLKYDTGTGKVGLPSNALRVDPVDVYSSYVQRGKFLFDTENNTFVINKDVDCNLVVELPFDDLPHSVQQYIAAEGTYKLHLSEVGDEQKLQRLERLSVIARGYMRADELRNGDYNAVNTPTAARLYRRNRPYRRS